MRARRGVSLIELMIALALLGVGLLALAAASAALARHAARSALDVRAAGLARDLGERTAAAGCGAPAGGDTLAALLRAHWRAADDSGSRRLRVEVADAGGARAPRTFATRALCAEG